MADARCGNVFRFIPEIVTASPSTCQQRDNTGGGNSAGQAALYFANHAHKVTLVVRGDSLEKSMSRYLVEQLRGKSNLAVQLRSEVVGAHGDTYLMRSSRRSSSMPAGSR